MAKQKGHIKYVGTLGEVRHFKIKNKSGFFAGLKGGPTGTQVKNAPEFERTRENMNEFGGCAKAGKSVRNALAELMNQMGDGNIAGRLTRIMKKINLADESEARGYRAVLISTQRNYLKGLQFDNQHPFDVIFRAPFVITTDASRNKADLNIPVFNPDVLISAPSGATHFRLVLAIAALSDFAYVASSNSYEPIEAALNELKDIQYSSYQELKVNTPILNISAELPGAAVMTNDATLLICLGIEFYQKVGANYFLLNSGNSMKMVDAI